MRTSYEITINAESGDYERQMAILEVLLDIRDLLLRKER